MNVRARLWTALSWVCFIPAMPFMFVAGVFISGSLICEERALKLQRICCVRNPSNAQGTPHDKRPDQG